MTRKGKRQGKSVTSNFEGGNLFEYADRTNTS